MENLLKRRILATERIDILKGELVLADNRVKGKACVYVTGSFGRGEASEHSDLDLFIIGKSDGTDKKKSLCNCSPPPVGWRIWCVTAV